jgi:hypothetical protein
MAMLVVNVCIEAICAAEVGHWRYGGYVEAVVATILKSFFFRDESPQIYSIRSILVAADLDVSRHISCIDTSISATTSMKRRE